MNTYVWVSFVLNCLGVLMYSTDLFKGETHTRHVGSCLVILKTLLDFAAGNRWGD